MKHKDERISPKEVMDILDKENPYYLYKMIQRTKSEEGIDVHFYRNKINMNSFDSLQSFYEQTQNN